MGNHSNKLDENEYFTDYEYSKLSDAFNINRHELSNVTGDTFRVKWSHFMVQSLMETWIQYFIRNEFHYQFRASFDLERFSRLYKDQTSPFIDTKAQGIIRIILGSDLSDRILGINHARVVEYFRDVIISYMRGLDSSQNDRYQKWLECGSTHQEHHQKKMINHFVSHLGSTQSMVTELDLETWFREKPFVDDVLGNLLDLCYCFHEYDEVYHPLLPLPTSATFTVLDVSHVLFLAAHLMTEFKRSWVLVFSSNTHGHNFAKFSVAVRETGPTILVIKENEGNLFGCFASESWKASPQFYGDSRCFIFQLSPRTIILQASGFNNNFMYHNHNQQTLPNGFGMGGQLGFWGLWLDSDFGKGRCENYCSTFKNYVLPSGKAEFTFDYIEVWAVHGDSVNVNAEERPIAASITERDPSAKAVIQMASKPKPDEYQ